MDTDAKRIAEAFRQIYSAAMQINEILGRRDDLNDSVPKEWPLQWSADEFAAECAAMVDHYDAKAEKEPLDRVFGNRVYGPCLKAKHANK
jgi:hypothetical protein